MPTRYNDAISPAATSGSSVRQSLLALMRRRDAHLARHQRAPAGEARLIDRRSTSCTSGRDEPASAMRSRELASSPPVSASAPVEQHLRVEQQRLTQQRARGVGGRSPGRRARRRAR